MVKQSITQAMVISLDDSQRLTGFFEQPGSKRFEVFHAFDGRRDPNPDQFDHVAFLRRQHRQPSPGEVGCAMSHYLVQREFAISEGLEQDLLLVAEDDARLSRDTDQVLEQIQRYGGIIDYAVLATPFDEAGRRELRSVGSKLAQLSLLARCVGPRGRRWKYRLGHVDGSVWGAGLYLVSRRAARAYIGLVNELGGLSWAADEYALWGPMADVDVKLLVPNLAGWEGSSTIREVSDIERNRERRALEATSGALSERLRRRIAVRTRLDYLRRVLSVSVRDLLGRGA